jgi:hypothetical protein
MESIFQRVGFHFSAGMDMELVTANAASDGGAQRFKIAGLAGRD